jgi:triacylglycerol lipase
VPADIVAGIRTIGDELSPENMARTQALLADQPRAYEAREIEVVTDLAYGPHERHRLDVHTDNYRRSSAPMPVVMFFHGGGFLFGARENERNVSDYFASLGLVGVNATYRLAPEATWPAGAEDVGAAVNWVKANIAEYGGDPEQIFVIGKSAGVEHVAGYVFRPELLPPGTATVAGAVFLSGTYTPNVGSPSAGELAYFGEDTDQWADRGILGNINRANIPILITVSEYDPPVYSRSLARLIHELAIDHGRMPRIAQLLGHNHYSSNVSIGTTDRTVSSEIVEFVRSTLDTHD